MKVAIMQPSFIPPASYFRLFAVSDVFVFLDDVQFNRRWFTHRQKLTNQNGDKEWLTLPIKKTDRDTTMIKDLEWQNDWQIEWNNRCLKFPIFGNAENVLCGITRLIGNCSPLQFISGTLAHLRQKLDLSKQRLLCPIEFSSMINVDSSLRGQDRILAICKKLGATEYINSPGGKHMYDKFYFDKEGIELTFLPDYTGSMDSIVERLANESPEKIREEIYDQI